jgi:16S rRNA processing protein RimM
MMPPRRPPRGPSRGGRPRTLPLGANTALGLTPGIGTSPAVDPAPVPPARAPGNPADRAVTLAAVVGAHGITGEVRLKLFSEELERYGTFEVDGRTLTLKSLRPGPNGAVARFAEIADRNAAEALRGTVLTVPRSALPPLAEGEYYHADLVGLPCLCAGEPIGTAVAVENFGAGDVVEIERPDGSLFMVPVALAVTVEPERLLIDPDFVEA